MHPPRRQRRHRSVVALTFVWAAACATGNGSAIPRGSPRLAEGSTPEPMRFEVVVRGQRPMVRSRVARLLTDSLFHVTSTDQGVVTAYSLARLTKIRVEVAPAGKDSMRVALTGETYIGDTTRPDSISGLPERWRLITAADPGAVLLRGLARALRPPRGDRTAPTVSVAGTATTTGASNGGAALSGNVAPGGPPRPVVDPAVGAILAMTPVGRAADVCRNTPVPPGWLVLFWYRDPARCTELTDQWYPGEPNMMRLEREW